jgi:hypothetical protein
VVAVAVAVEVVEGERKLVGEVVKVGVAAAVVAVDGSFREYENPLNEMVKSCVQRRG